MPVCRSSPFVLLHQPALLNHGGPKAPEKSNSTVSGVGKGTNGTMGGTAFG